MTIDLVRLQRVRLAEAMLGVGLVLPGGRLPVPIDTRGPRPGGPIPGAIASSVYATPSACACAHDVRHFVATTLLTSGVDLATVAGRLGHGGGGKTALAIYSYFLREPDRVAWDLMASVLERQDNAAQRPLETNVLPMSKHTSKSG